MVKATYRQRRIAVNLAPCSSVQRRSCTKYTPAPYSPQNPTLTHDLSRRSLVRRRMHPPMQTNRFAFETNPIHNNDFFYINITRTRAKFNSFQAIKKAERSFRSANPDLLQQNKFILFYSSLPSCFCGVPGPQRTQRVIPKVKATTTTRVAIAIH